MIEEQSHGRLLLINENGDLEWEYINKSDDEKVYQLTWSRILRDKKLIKQIREIIKNKNC